MELHEDSQDPNLTQLPQNSILALPHGKQTADPRNGARKVSQSLSNIASLQTGLNIKRQLAEDDLAQPLPAPANGALNLLRPATHDQIKLRPKSFFQESVNDLSQLSQDFDPNQPAFSTPVRSSFRGGNLRPRPHTVIHLEEAKTPSKREGKTRLRELKTRQGRRWSAVENYDYVDGQQIHEDENVDPALVAVWSQFVNYEPSGIPALSSMVTPSMR